MKSILLTNRYSGRPLEIVTGTIPDGFRLLMLDSTTPECLECRISEADYVLASGRLKITASLLEKCSKLKMIQRSGVGLDTLDLAAIRNAGIPLYVNHGVNAESVAEHTLLLILACMRKLTVMNSNTRNGIWKKQEQGVMTYELRGKTVGIIGMGYIAQSLVHLLDAFGVSILYHDLAQMSADYEQQHNMKYVELNELLSQSDIVTLHCALNDQTRNLIDKQAINVMKAGAILINTARGQIVNATDLAHALQCGKLSFAGIDVHEHEPIANDYPLRSIENVIMTPHIAGITCDSFGNMMRNAMRNIEKFEKGEFADIAQYRYL